MCLLLVAAVWIFVASLTKMMEDQINCRTQRPAGHAPGAIGLEISCASEPENSLDADEVSAVGSYCFALGAGLVKWWAYY